MRYEIFFSTAPQISSTVAKIDTVIQFTSGAFESLTKEDFVKILLSAFQALALRAFAQMMEFLKLNYLPQIPLNGILD